MAKYKPEIDICRQNAALRFLKNLLDNRNEIIQDRDVFTVAEKVLDKPRLRDWCESEIHGKQVPGKHGNQVFGRGKRKEVEIIDPDDFFSDNNEVDFNDTIPEILRSCWSSPELRPAVRKLIGSLKVTVKDSKTGFRRRFSKFCRLLALSDVEQDVLMVGYLVWAGLLEWPDHESSRGGNTSRVECYAQYVDRSLAEVRAALSRDGTLRRCGCMDNDFDFVGRVAEYFDGLKSGAIDNKFYTKDDAKPLPWSWFGTLAEEHGAILKRLLSVGAGPCNILLYGEPGTGKTSFARALAAETGRSCWAVSSNPDEYSGGNYSGGAQTRCMAVRVCNGMVNPDRDLVVVDEADSLLCDCEKGAVNALLDAARAPTVWICNASTRRMDKSNMRRFDYSVRFDPLTESQRANIWENQISDVGLAKIVGSDAASRWAAKWPVSAGTVASVLRSVARLSPGKDEVGELVYRFIKTHCKLLGVTESDAAHNKPARDYSLEGINIKTAVPLSRILEAARTFRAESEASSADHGADAPRFNLLLSGPPGTGKTEFVKYLGAELGAKVIVKMGSNLLDSFVGRTEQNIAAAFREAEDEKAVLFLDEVDGLLRSRAMAQRSWEVTQVNELLHQMENFRGILVCATNFADNLDPATVRRFTFKVGFDYLTDSSKALFFERFFGLPLPERARAELYAIPDLAPGDFRTVRQSLYYLGSEPDVAMILRALREESEAKSNRIGVDSPRRRMGFLP